MSIETIFSALESSRLARTVLMARDTASSTLILAGEGTISALFRSAVLSVFPFAARTTKSPPEAGGTPERGRVPLHFQDGASLGTIASPVPEVRRSPEKSEPTRPGGVIG